MGKGVNTWYFKFDDHDNANKFYFLLEQKQQQFKSKNPNQIQNQLQNQIQNNQNNHNRFQNIVTVDIDNVNEEYQQKKRQSTPS